MRVLLTGANGQVGRCVQDVFAGSIHDLKPMDRGALDITDSAAVSRAVKAVRPDIIINAAAYTAVDKAESEPERAYAINVTGSANLAEAASEIGALLIHISTDYVFDGKASIPYVEDHPTNPQCVYGRTKLQGEAEIQIRCNKHIILRTAWVFSEYGNNFLKTMLRLGQERDELGIVDDQRGCPTYARDIARAVFSICEQYSYGREELGIYHFCGNEEVSWYQFADLIFQCAFRVGSIKKVPATKPILTQDYPTPALRPAYSGMSVIRFKSSYGVVPNSLSKNIEDCLAGLGHV
ncbi:dTDP-4-dehydrorhamnose reductase [Spongiibacter tropicus]|uniref:dTDP-4-dehydrorhamnose reductase n=1 Tax=Spongiibacter tropicus TaxID=454602 RepID=UPI00300BD210